MHRSLRPLGLAAGLFVLATVVGSCNGDRPTAPQLARIGATPANAIGPVIVITEILADPAAVADGSGEWFEVFNAGDTPINLKNYRILSGPNNPTDQHTIATDVIVPSGGYAVFGNNANSATNGGVTVTYAYQASFALNNSNTDWIAIKAPTPDNALLDSVSYSPRSAGAVVAPTFTPTTGASRVLTPANVGTVDNTIIGGNANWANTPTGVTFGSGDRGTPGSGPYTILTTGELDRVVFQAPTASAVTVGSSVTLTAIAQDGSNNTVSASYSWSTNNANVTLTNASSATVTVAGASAGSSNVTVTATLNGTSKSATQAITVTAPVVASVTVSPATATIINGGTQQFTAQAFDATPTLIPGTTFTWVSSDDAIATVSATGLATAHLAGDVTISAKTANNVTGSATLHIDPLIPPPTVRFSEIHYDNTGTDVGEALEIEGPAGTDLTNWKIVLYNGNPNPPDEFNPPPLAAYDTRILTGVIQARAACNGRGVLTFTYPLNGIGNGNQGGTQPDGFALVNPSNQVVEFLSYEGSFTAVDGPAAGMTSKNIGVMEDNPVPPAGRSLQRSTDGTTWAPAGLATFDRCNLEGPPPPPNGISFSGRVLSNGDPPLPVGYEDQLFATLRDGVTNQVITTTWTWTSETPDLASIDANGVMHGKAPGTAVFKATAVVDGTSATYSFPIEELQESNAVYQNHAEFGEPADADPSDDYILRHREFISSYNKNRGSPNWVAYNLEASHFTAGSSDRCDCFTHDPLLPASFPRLTTADYTGAGGFLGLSSPETLDRGHMTRSSDRMSHTLDNANTYLLSNIVPQFGDLNQGPWNNFEQYLHDLAGAGLKEIFIITGPAGNAGTLKNDGKIVMPTHTWKVAVIMDRDETLADVHSAADLEVLAVIMPNVDPRTVDIRGVDWHTYLTTVDAVEALSGYDVLALLDDQIEIAVESNTKPPVAKAGGPYTGTEASSLALSASGSSDPDGDALTYAWTFGDGSTGTGVSPSHTYATYGDFTVSVKVTDARGLFATATTTAHVNNVPPTLSAVSGATIVAGNTYNATGTFSDPGADPFSATVDYGDGTGVSALGLSGNGFALTHTYASHGSFTVTVTLSDGQATATRTATVVVRAIPVANAGGPYVSNEGSSVTLDGSASSDADGSVATYAWNFGDGASGSGVSPAHSYAQDGSYTVTLVVTDNHGLTSSTTTTLSVSNVAPSVAAFAGAAILPHGTYGASGGFTDPGADSWSATVDYGDGSGTQPLSLSGTSFSLSHTYAAAGSYTVTVVVSDGTESGSRTAIVTVKTFVQAAQDIASLLNGINSLNAKLNAAIQQLGNGNTTPALNQLAALLNEVDAMVRSRRMESADAAAIRSAVNALVSSMSS